MLVLDFSLRPVETLGGLKALKENESSNCLRDSKAIEGEVMSHSGKTPKEAQWSAWPEWDYREGQSDSIGGCPSRKDADASLGMYPPNKESFHGIAVHGQKG